MRRGPFDSIYELRRSPRKGVIHNGDGLSPTESPNNFGIPETTLESFNRADDVAPPLAKLGSVGVWDLFRALAVVEILVDAARGGSALALIF